MTYWDDHISISLTPLAIIVCCHLIYHWWGRFVSFIKGNREPISYIGVGVTIYHFGTIQDNAYWLAAWSSLIKDHWLKNYLFDYGSLSNLIFRQGFVIVGAWFQVVGVMKFHKTESDIGIFYKHCIVSLMVGVFYSLSLSL